MTKEKALAVKEIFALNEPYAFNVPTEVKYYKYQISGGKENYKEILVTLPVKKLSADAAEKRYYENFIRKGGDKSYEELTYAEKIALSIKVPSFSSSGDPQFKSTHFDEPNILVHLRMNTRKDSQGNKVLFLEEIQSDWGQKGKREGFVEKLEPITKNNSTIEKINDRESDFAYKLNYKGKDLAFVFNDEKHLFKNQSEIDNVLIHRANRDYARSQQDKTPSAPFVMDTNAWTKLALKVALKEAVKQGEQMQRTAFEKLVDEKMDWVEARMKKLGKLEVKCP
jgi:hypothetical protein